MANQNVKRSAGLGETAGQPQVEAEAVTPSGITASPAEAAQESKPTGLRKNGRPARLDFLNAFESAAAREAVRQLLAAAQTRAQVEGIAREFCVLRRENFPKGVVAIPSPAKHPLLSDAYVIPHENGYQQVYGVEGIEKYLNEYLALQGDTIEPSSEFLQRHADFVSGACSAHLVSEQLMQSHFYGGSGNHYDPMLETPEAQKQALTVDPEILGRIHACQITLLVLMAGGINAQNAALSPADWGGPDDRAVGAFRYKTKEVMRAVQRLTELAEANGLDPHNLPKPPGWQFAMNLAFLVNEK